MTWYRILLYCPWPFWHGINTITRASIALWPSLKKKKQFANRSDTSPGPISSFLKKKKKKTCVCRSTIEFPLGHDSWATRLTSCASEEKKMTVIDKCFFFLPTDRLKKKKKQLTTKGTRFLEMSPSPVTMATMSREYQTEHQQHRVTEHSPHQIFAPNTKGLLNAPGQNNCFLNSAVQVSSSFLFF